MALLGFLPTSYAAAYFYTREDLSGFEHTSVVEMHRKPGPTEGHPTALPTELECRGNWLELNFLQWSKFYSFYSFTFLLHCFSDEPEQIPISGLNNNVAPPDEPSQNDGKDNLGGKYLICAWSIFWLIIAFHNQFSSYSFHMRLAEKTTISYMG